MIKYIVLIFVLVNTQFIFGLPNKSIEHSHNSRNHSHPLPKSGLKHSHNNGSINKNRKTYNKQKIKNKIQKISTVIFRNIKSNTTNKIYGQYSSNTLRVSPIKGTRKVRLLETLTFTEPNGKKWIAPKGHVVDGASIPIVAQPLVGTPYGGKYVMASVIHDVACDEKKEKWQNVHKVFHYAMLVSGVQKSKADKMYKAVYLGGPRWGKDAEKALSNDELKALIAKEEFRELRNDFKKKDVVSLEILGQLKKYKGFIVYSGETNAIGNSFAGATKRVNDFSATIHSESNINFRKKKVNTDTTVGIKYESSKYKVSVEKGIGKKNAGYSFGFGINPNTGGNVIATKKDAKEFGRK